MRSLPLTGALAVLTAVGVLSLTACGDGDDDSVPTDVNEAASETETETEVETEAETETETETLYPDVVDVSAERDGDGTWTFAVTLSSPYDSPQRYADAWRVVGPDGDVYGERILLHDHANEQPFTRSQSGIEIPDGVTEVLVEGRDQVSGWGGQTMTYQLPG